MKKQLAIILGGMLSLPISHSALADSQFDGIYGGLSMGYVDSKAKGTEQDPDTGEATGYTYKNNMDGATLGALLGYNKVFSSNWLLGIEADYEGRDTNNKKSERYQGVPDPDYM